MTEDRDEIGGKACGPKHRLLAGMAVILVLLAAALTVVGLRSSPRYFAKVTMEVDAEQPTPDGSINHQFLDSQLQLLRTKEILYPVIEELALGPVFAKGTDALPTSEVCPLLLRSLDFRKDRNTGFIEIGVYSSNPELAANISNTIAKVYRNKRMGAAMKTIERSIANLEAEVQKRRHAVDKAAVEAANLRNQEGIIDPDPDSYGTLISAPNGKDSARAYIDAKSRYIQQRKLLESAQKNVQAERTFVSPERVTIRERAEARREPVCGFRRFW